MPAALKKQRQQGPTKRSTRLRETIGLTSTFKAMLEASRRGALAMTLSGSLLWASKTAAEWLNLRKGRRRDLPPALVTASRQLGDLVRGKDISSTTNAAQITIPQEGGRRLKAQLRLVRSTASGYFVIAELEIEGLSPETTRKLAPFRLTPTEIKVLDLITQGLSDREIGQRLFVSRPTVRTHIGRILGKLGVSSRLQAALLANSL
ncbi:response regulator transcription factor [Deltaproteobacteria bacterium PRO3]|nr:response regulator transcription factor [Deltaproteobacteria bacterium PRO3]